MENMNKGARGPWRRARREENSGPEHPRMRRGPHGHDHGHGRGFGPEFGQGGFGPGGFGPGFGPGPFGRGRGRGGRGRRGDVRAAILLLLQERPMHGYELIQQIRERSEDVWRPSPGSIYPALSQLEDEGLVIIEKVAGRKTAKLTESGTAYIEENRADLGDPWQDVKDGVGDQALDLRGLVGQLMGAVAQVAAVGTPAQAAKAAEVLTEARKALYRILAEDDTPEK
ncbi:PadR family transcriptional regulator [Nocardia uniformis]|uniref:PadR family transcriptional regulator n=1 Tax=Nocardia uniformis TaxID=53432 RepID=A0A849C1R5_9NOCA|nr:PadR family transcriptional regulator [Nocardia uniformis]NNH71628.1 PadR family transcriptional regulator [Nocardia uniformis]